MKTVYELELLDSVPAIKSGANEYILIDTGSPLSFSSSGNISINGNLVTVARSLDSVNTTYLSTQFNRKINGLIGMDIMRNLIMRFDYNKKELAVSDEETANDLHLTRSDIVKQWHSIPIIQIFDHKTNRHLNAIIDTGAKHSYVRSEIVQNLSFTAVISDFNPSLGQFQAKSYSGFEYRIGNNTIIHPVCEYEPLNPLLKRFSVDALLGYDLLKLGTWKLNSYNISFLFN